MALTTYFDFAEDDYQYYSHSYLSGDSMPNSFGAMSQNICERYMKHLVDAYVEPQTYDEQNRKSAVLRTHNLRALINYLNDTAHIHFSEETQEKMSIIDGLYFTTRYPGYESLLLSAHDFAQCYDAVTSCREETLQIIQEHEHPLTEDGNDSPEENQSSIGSSSCEQCEQNIHGSPMENDNPNNDSQGRERN